jgi:hypothetical protein
MGSFYANENFPLPVVEGLRSRGHEVLTTGEAGRASAAVPDEEVLAFAVSRNLAVLTLNRRHFIRLHQERPDHAGIVVCTFDADFPALAERIHARVSPLTSLRGILMRITRA